MRTLLLWGLVALGVWAGAAVLGLAVRWHPTATPAAAAAWAAAVILAVWREWRRGYPR